MFEDLIIALIVAAAACFAATRLFFRKDAGCACGGACACARSAAGEAPLTPKEQAGAARCACARVH